MFHKEYEQFDELRIIIKAYSLMDNNATTQTIIIVKSNINLPKK